MGWRNMAVVWDHFNGHPTEKLVLLYVAKHANDETQLAFPSVGSIARQCCISDKQARRYVHSFADRGLLKPIGNGTGGNPTKGREYVLMLDEIRASTPPADDRGNEPATPPAHGTPPMDGTPPTHVPYPSHGCPLPLPPMGAEPDRTRQNQTSMGSSNPTRARAKPDESTKVVLPDWLPPDAWERWHRYRKAKSGKGWTPDAARLSLRKLSQLRDSGHNPVAVIDQSIERTWTGLFPVKDDQAKSAHRPPGKATRAESIAEHNARLFAEIGADADAIDVEAREIHDPQEAIEWQPAKA